MLVISPGWTSVHPHPWHHWDQHARTLLGVFPSLASQGSRCPRSEALSSDNLNKLIPIWGALVTFHCCDKYSLREKRFILALGFRGFNPWSPGSIDSGPVCGKAVIHGREHMGKQSVSLLADRSRENDRNRLGTRYALPGNAPSDPHPPMHPAPNGHSV
jgi:hypothetical protein